MKKNEIKMARQSVSPHSIIIGLLFGLAFFGFANLASAQLKENIRQDLPEVSVVSQETDSEIKIKYENLYAPLEKKGEKNIWDDGDKKIQIYKLPATEEMEKGGIEIELILNSIPDKNEFEFTIEGSDDYDFEYQPFGVSKKEYRPENVKGSYAVFNKKTGEKEFHIYRPLIWDSAGTKIWGEMYINEGKIKIKVDWDFLNNAIYPITIDPTMGYTSIGASVQTVDGYDWIGEKSLSTSTGWITSVSAYVKRNSGGTSVMKGMVTDSAFSILTNGISSTTSFTSLAGSWVTGNYSASTTISSSLYYCGIIVDNSFDIYYDTTGAVSGDSFIDTTNDYPTPTNPTDASAQTRKMSIYCTYSASATSGGGSSTTTTGTSTVIIANIGEITFGLAIIIVILSIAFIGYIWNSFNKKKPWK